MSMSKIMAEKLVDNEIARLTYVEQGLGHSDEGDRTRRLRDALLIVTGRDPEFDGPMAALVARHLKRVGKAGRVIAKLRDLDNERRGRDASTNNRQSGIDGACTYLCARCGYVMGPPGVRAEDADLLAALEGLRNRGVLTAEQAEEAKRRIAAGGEA